MSAAASSGSIRPASTTPRRPGSTGTRATRVDAAALDKVAEYMADALRRRDQRCGRCRRRSRSSISPSRSPSSAASTASWSPAASREYVYGREERDFGDMGRRLGQALRKRLDAGALPWPLLPAGECIRATALGASEYSVQLSGNTSTITNPGALLPRRNLQVLQPPYVCEETIDPDKLAAAIRAHFTAFDLTDGEAEVALALRWRGAPSHERIFAFAQGIVRGMPQTIAQQASRSTSCSTATWRRRSARSCARSWACRAKSW